MRADFCLNVWGILLNGKTHTKKGGGDVSCILSGFTYNLHTILLKRVKWYIVCYVRMLGLRSFRHKTFTKYASPRVCHNICLFEYLLSGSDEQDCKDGRDLKAQWTRLCYNDLNFSTHSVTNDQWYLLLLLHKSSQFLPTTFPISCAIFFISSYFRLVGLLL